MERNHLKKFRYDTEQQSLYSRITEETHEHREQEIESECVAQSMDCSLKFIQTAQHLHKPQIPKSKATPYFTEIQCLRKLMNKGKQQKIKKSVPSVQINLAPKEDFKMSQEQGLSKPLKHLNRIRSEIIIPQVSAKIMQTPSIETPITVQRRLRTHLARILSQQKSGVNKVQERSPVKNQTVIKNKSVGHLHKQKSTASLKSTPTYDTPAVALKNYYLLPKSLRTTKQY